MKRCYIAVATIPYSNGYYTVLGAFENEEEAWACIRKCENNYGDYDGNVIETEFFNKGEWDE